MRININGVRLYFDVEGLELVPDGAHMRKKQTLILLHGGPGYDHSSFKPQFSILSSLVQIIYLDHRANGRSDRGSSDNWNLRQWADDLRVFCEMLDIEKPIIFGHSFGGFVAMEYATRFPDHPSKLILSSTHARMQLSRVLAAFHRLGGQHVQEVARDFLDNPSEKSLEAYNNYCIPKYNQTPQDPDISTRTLRNSELLLAFAAQEWPHFNFLPALSSVKVQTLVIAGEDDPITPIEDAEDIVNALPQDLVQFVRFSECGHGVFRDKPNEFFKIIREFIQQD
ncbi:MAG: alpha/beta fold hydrolase [Methylococcaceae bacterium]